MNNHIYLCYYVGTCTITTWREGPKGKIYKSDVVFAKNYLQKE